MKRFWILIVLASIGLGIPTLACEGRNQHDASPAASAQSMKTVSTVKFVATEATQVVKFPPKTRNVDFVVSGGGMYCSHLMLTYLDGKTSSWLIDSHLRDKGTSGRGIAEGYPGEIVSLEAVCKSDGASASLVVDASP